MDAIADRKRHARNRNGTHNARPSPHRHSLEDSPRAHLARLSRPVARPSLRTDNTDTKPDAESQTVEEGKRKKVKGKREDRERASCLPFCLLPFSFCLIPMIQGIRQTFPGLRRL